MILHHVCSHIRKSAARSLFAAPRGLSQLVTSFVASESQGILHVPFSPFRFSFAESRLFVYSLVRSLHTSLVVSLCGDALRLALALTTDTVIFCSVCASLVRLLLYELVFYLCYKNLLVCFASTSLLYAAPWRRGAEWYLRLPSCQCPLFQSSPWQS